MKRVSIVLAVMVISSSGVAWAQSAATKSATAGKSDTQTISPGDLKPTETMWFYQQAMRQYADPKVAVRQAAELRGQQRRQRLAALEWYGLSNSAPAGQFRPLPRRLCTRLGRQQHLQPVPLVRGPAPVVVVNPDTDRCYR